MTLDDRFQRLVGRSGSYRDVTVDHTDGNYLVSPDDERYVDFVAGWCVVNAGYGRDVILDRARAADDRTVYVKPSYRNEAVVSLAETLERITPGDLSHVFRVTSGSEAVETAVKAARNYTGRPTIIVNEDSYHGHTYAGMSAGNPDAYEAYAPLVPEFVRIPSPTELPHDEWIDRLRQAFEEHDAAAYLSETVLTHQGVFAPEEGHYTDVRAVCDEHDALLMLDEVANGFGRTGELLAVDRYDVEPDVMTFAKGFSSGYAPIGATITTQAVGQALSDEGGTYSTFGWTPHAVAAAQTNIDIIEDEDLPQQARTSGETLAELIRDADLDVVKTVRQHGLLIGIAFSDDIAKEVRAAGVDHGVLTGTTNKDNVLLLSPPLNIAEDYMEDGVDRLVDAIRDAA